MGFNFGAGLKNAASGMSEVAGNQIKNMQAIDMQKELLELQSAKQLALEEAKFKRDEQRKDEHTKKIQSITGSVETDDDKAGGYEPEGAKEKRMYGLLQRKVDALNNAEEYDAAKVLQGQLDKLDTKNSKEAKLELDKLLYEQKVNYQTGLLDSKNEQIKMQGEVAAAKIDAANARGAAGNKPTDADKEYQAYVDDVKSNGRKDSKGNLSKIPLSRDRFNNAQDAIKEKSKIKDTESTTVEYTDPNDPLKTIKETRKGSPKATTSKPVKLASDYFK